MRISEERKADTVIIAPEGRLDSINAPILEHALATVIDRGDTRLIIDFTGLDYISSIGLSVLLTAAKRLKRLDGRIVLAGMNDRVGMVMEISGFNRIFVIFPSVEHALA